jgi:hypothetical protein
VRFDGGRTDGGKRARHWGDINQTDNTMRLPLAIAMEVGSFLDQPCLTVCATQLCWSGVGFVARPYTDSAKVATTRLQNLVELCRTASRTLEVGQTQADGLASEAVKRINLCLAQRTSAEKVVFVVELIRLNDLMNKDFYSDIHRHFPTASLTTARVLLSSGTHGLNPSPRLHLCLGRGLVVV